MSRPVTRSMTTLITNGTMPCGPPMAHVNPSPFLLLPGELRNMIYRDVLAPSPLTCDFHRATLFGSQPAITRVNRQIRAEALSIYYAETAFILHLELRIDRRRPTNSIYRSRLKTDPKRVSKGSKVSFLKSSFMSYVDFCQTMESVASAQRQIPGYQGLLRHVRNLWIHNSLEACFGPTIAIFEKREGANLDPFASEEWYDVNWTDLDSIRAFVHTWMEKRFRGFTTSPALLLDQQERLINVLWLLGMHLRSD